MAASDATAPLASKLSPGAQIHLPTTEGYLSATDRWTEWSCPDFDVVIEAGTEDDVAAAVCWH